MNLQTYSFVLKTYGRLPAVWVGLCTEIIRSLMQRVWVAIIVAQIATDLATHDVAAARQKVVLFLIVYVVGAAVGAVGDLLALKAEDDEYEQLIQNYYRKLTGKDMSFYRDHQTGFLVSLFRQHMDSAMLLTRLLRVDFVRQFVSLVVPVIVLIIADRKLGAVVTGIVAVQIVYVLWTSTKAHRYRSMSHELYRKMTGEVSDHITNIVAFKSGGMSKQVFQKIEQMSKEETLMFWLRRKTVVLLDLPREVITAGGVALAFWVVLSRSASSPEMVGIIMLTLTYMFQIVRSVSELPNLITQHDDLITKLHPTLAYLGSAYETVSDPAKPKKLKVTTGSIDINGVNFAYAPHEGQDTPTQIFSDLHLHIAGGEQVGIVGLSGAGKSTLVSLLLRFDDVTSGSISIDGTDIRDITQDTLHQNIAYVPQEPLLFHSSIRQNIAYFTAKKVSARAIAQAAKAAHAHEFIEKLPGGYDTVVGERGIKLSGGQKQRVVIARAILKNAPIMIFDEATSALDTESEKIIQRALPKIIGKHTAVVIAHRLSTVAGLDRILVMHNGRIVESGTHQELLDLQGRYHALWQKQISA